MNCSQLKGPVPQRDHTAASDTQARPGRKGPGPAASGPPKTQRCPSTQTGRAGLGPVRRTCSFPAPKSKLFFEFSNLFFDCNGADYLSTWER